MGAAQSQDAVSLSVQQAGSSQRSPLPRRLHNLPLIPDTPGMRWCPMSKYLSTTQISCPGSLQGGECESRLGWPLSRGTEPLPERREQQRPPGGLAEFSSCLKSLNGVSCSSPSQFVRRLWITVPLQEGRSEDPSFPAMVDQQIPVSSCWHSLSGCRKHWGTPSLSSYGWTQESALFRLSHNETLD